MGAGGVGARGLAAGRSPEKDAEHPKRDEI